MRKSGRGIKKLRYAHPPVMLCDGKIYRLEPTEKCPVCGAERHLEEFEGRQVLVCNADRGHIAVLSSEGLFALVTGETVGGDTAAPIGESRGNDEESGEIGAEMTESGESKTEAAGTDAVDASQNDAAVKEEEDRE